MTVSSTYSIEFQALSPGIHEFQFDINDSLFTMWEESEIKHGKGTAVVTLNKAASKMVLDVAIASQVELECDRCLEEFRMPVDYHGQLTVKMTDQVIDQESDGDEMWLSYQADTLPLAQYFYESIVLSLPYQRVHPDMKDCNPAMLEKFKIVDSDEFEEIEQKMTAHTLENEIAQEEPEQFEKLKELKRKMEEEK